MIGQSLSAVIEWENAKSSDHSRASDMLRALLEQLEGAKGRLTGGAEILLVHDEGESTAAEVLAGVQAQLAGTSADIRVIGVKGLDYYQQKNHGAALAKGDLILLVDSDVVPAAGWLENLLRCQEEERADVVCGATHIEPRGLYGKAFALFWFFPLPSETKDRRRSSTFFANNVLFRGEVLRAHPFPDTPLVRGRCTQLAAILASHQKSMFIEGAAKVAHPPPNGLVHFIKRALCHGSDNINAGDAAGIIPALKRLKWRGASDWRRIWALRGEVALGAPGAAIATLIALGYNLLEFTGELITGANPTLIGQRIRV